MKNTWLISDTHFDHNNIIRYCGRPFSSVTEMNTVLLDNWNSLVQPQDTIYFLGDLAFGRGSRPAQWWLRQLKGNIMLIKGSHDNGLSAPHYRILHTALGDTLLLHDPADIPDWWPGWTIHGHSHNTRPFIDPESKLVNVSVEAIDYRPVSLERIIERTQVEAAQT